MHFSKPWIQTANSMFTEGKVAVERQLSLMQVKNIVTEEAKSIFQRDKQHEVINLYTAEGSQTKFEQQEQLSAMLKQKNGEIKHLLGEISNLEKFKNLYGSMESKPSALATLVP